MNEQQTAKHWRVRFKCKDESYHSIWFGDNAGSIEYPISEIREVAEDYLKSNNTWLESIDAIDPWLSTS